MAFTKNSIGKILGQTKSFQYPSGHKICESKVVRTSVLVELIALGYSFERLQTLCCGYLD
jgi:hypothetical protein